MKKWIFVNFWKGLPVSQWWRMLVMPLYHRHQYGIFVLALFGIGFARIPVFFTPLK